MTDPHSSASLRASALALLADGNSAESVSHVLGVPVDDIQAWTQHAGVAPAPAARPFPVGRSLEFDSEVDYRYPLYVRVLMGGLCLFLVAVALLLGSLDRAPSSGELHAGTLVAVVIVAAGLFVPLLLSPLRWRFSFGRHGLTERRAFSTTPELRYPDIVKTTIARDSLSVGRGGRVWGWTVVFHSLANATEPLSLFIREAMPLEVEIVDRLRQLPGVSAHDVAPLMNLPVRPRRPVGKWAGFVLIAVLLVLAVKTASVPMSLLQQLRRGQPSTAELTHVTGDLRRFSGCGHDPMFQGRGIDASLRLEDGRSVHAWIPCVMPRGVFTDNRNHALSVDSWQDGDAQPVVYRVVLDDRTLLSYEGVRARRAASVWFLGMTVSMLVVVWLLLLTLAVRLLDDQYWSTDD